MSTTVEPQETVEFWKEKFNKLKLAHTAAKKENAALHAILGIKKPQKKTPKKKPAPQLTLTAAQMKQLGVAEDKTQKKKKVTVAKKEKKTPVKKET